MKNCNASTPMDQQVPEFKKAIARIKQDYPGGWPVGILQVLYPGKGWLDRPMGFNHFCLRHLREMGVTHINIRVMRSHDRVSDPDYAMADLGYPQLPKEPQIRTKPHRKTRKQRETEKMYCINTGIGALLYGLERESR